MRLIGLLLACCCLVAMAGGDKEESYYDILGVPKDADTKQIKRAYRKQALKWHPDKNKDRKEEAEKRFVQVAEAYEVLSNPDARAKYDRYGKDGARTGGGDSGFSDFNFRNANDLFKDIFGDSDPFADFNSFFDDVEEEEFDYHEPAVAITGLKNFYKQIGKAKTNCERMLRKFKGKEDKLFAKIQKKYSKKFPQAVALLMKTWREAGMLGESKKRKGDIPGFGDAFENMGSMFGNFGRMGNFGGMGTRSSFSFSSTTFSSGGKRKTVRKQSTMQGGRRVTRTIESDGKTTTATEEEDDGSGRVKRKRGRKMHRIPHFSDTDLHADL